MVLKPSSPFATLNTNTFLNIIFLFILDTAATMNNLFVYRSSEFPVELIHLKRLSVMQPVCGRIKTRRFLVIDVWEINTCRDFSNGLYKYLLYFVDSFYQIVVIKKYDKQSIYLKK